MTATPSTFISNLYARVLLRSLSAGTATAAELLAWDNLRSANVLTEAQITSAISASSEVTTIIAPLIRIYQTFFNRVPDNDGLTFWASRIRAGGSFQDVGGSFATSPEFQSIYGAPSVAATQAFVNALYVNVLGRLPDSGGLAFWTLRYQELGANSGAASSIANGFASSAEFIANTQASIRALLAFSISEGSFGTGSLFSASAGANFTLTSGRDSFVGTATKDVISSGGIDTLGATDSLDGGDGLDTLNVQLSTAGMPVGVTIRNIETLNVTTSAVGFAVETALYSGVATFSLTASRQGAGLIDVNGAGSITVNAQGATTGNITVGPSTSPTGIVTINQAVSGSGITSGFVLSKGGSTVSIAVTGSNPDVNTDLTIGAISVTGTIATTSVSVTQTAAVTKSATLAGIVNAAVTITDVNYTSKSLLGTITTLSLSNFGAVTANSTALATVTLAGTGDSYTQGSGSLSSAQVTTQALTLNAVTLTGGITLATGLTTVTVSGALGASKINGALTASDATSVTFSGDRAIAFTGGVSFASTAAIAVEGSGGLTLGNLGVDQSFTGGSGVDVVGVAPGGTKAISGGAGDDVITLNGVLSGGTISGGAGTDTIVMTSTLAGSLTSAQAATITEFEVLRLSDSKALTLDLSRFSGINTVIYSTGVSGVTDFLNTADGFTFTQTAGMTANTRLFLADFSGASDRMTLAFRAIDGFVSTGTIIPVAIELLTITTTDTDSIGNNAAIVTPISAIFAHTVTISGLLGVNLTGGINHAGLKILDASGLTGRGSVDGLTFVSGALGLPAMVTGAAFASNQIDFSAALQPVTYQGGAGVDVITFATANSQANLIRLGNGANIVSGSNTANGANQIFGGSDIDTVSVGSGANILSLGAGNDVVSVGTGANLITGGAGADTLTYAPITSISVISTFVDASAGDRLSLPTMIYRDATASLSGKLGPAVALPAGASLQSYLDAAMLASQAFGGTTWFQFQGGTYVATDLGGDSTSFVLGQDAVVQLGGLLDLSNATIVSNQLTLV
jgi:S-layer protein